MAGHDVIIAGAGIMGLNVAHQLWRRAPRSRILVLERATGLGHGSSGWSTGFLRAHYSLDETVRLALDGIAAFKSWPAYLGNLRASDTFTETGALWMLGKSKAENEAMQVRLSRFGISSDVLNACSLSARFPLINTEPYPEFTEEGDIVPQPAGQEGLSALFEEGCGYVDPAACLHDLLATVRANGVDVRFNVEVDSVLVSASTCRGVRLADGQELHAAHVVNATGPWFDRLMKSADVRMSTTAVPTRIQVAHKRVPEEYLSLPFTADAWGPSGIYFVPRKASKQLLFGSIAQRFESETVEPDACNRSLDPDVRQSFLHCLLHRLPNLCAKGEIVGFSSMCAKQRPQMRVCATPRPSLLPLPASYSGCCSRTNKMNGAYHSPRSPVPPCRYTVNIDDAHPMVGETHVRGLWACNGFSGHGFKLAPAVGSLLAQQITGVRTDAWETDVAWDFLGPYRAPLMLKQNSVFA